ncbi:MAG: response regulator [Verrucomicrobia bacterium]|nr:response regulator [Verrucomicrobiota bacterium]
MRPPIPDNDEARVAVLRSLGLLDTPPEPEFDELTRLAAHICGVPMSVISLIDTDRQWFKSKLGFDPTETHRDESFCAHVIARPGDDLLEVSDARKDPRFADNPAVTNDGIRFYAGAPLVTHDGWSLGTLCVFDRQPRHLTPEQQSALATLRRHVVNAIELRRLVEKQRRTITDLELTRRDLDQARRDAEAAALAKSRFLAAMSHEIRTPMNAVIGMTALLGSTPLNPEQHDAIETIRTSGELLLTVINDILDFSKIESGKLELEAVPFDLKSCLASTVDLIAPRAIDKQIALRTEIAPGTPAVIVGDITRLRQILINLLSNAVKFTAKGEIVIHVSSAPRFDGRLEVTFRVTDTGIGIPADRLNRLFQEFSQVDSSTARQYGGSGLGLVISKRLAELHGGRMWVESTAGRGSSFFFTIAATPAALPAGTNGAAPVAEFDANFAARHPARILVTDDNPVNLKVVSRMLEKLGYQPATATSGADALAALRTQPFDLVFMDIEMPTMDGPTATRQLRAELPAARQPAVVALTAHALASDRDSFLAAGMDAYLAKPLRLAELTELLARLPTLRTK